MFIMLAIISVDIYALSQMPQKEINYGLELMPSFDEMRPAIKQTNLNMASGKDSIPTELFKAIFLSIFQISNIL